MILEETKNIRIKDLKLEGLNSERKKLLYRLGLFTVYDVLTYFPIRYEDRTERKSFSDVIKDISLSFSGKVNATVVAKVIGHEYINTKNGKVLKVILSDGR